MTPRETAEAILELSDGLIGITTEMSGLERFTERVCSSADLKELARAYLETIPHEDSFEDTIIAKALLDLHKT
jgi:hypothetical protein